MITVIIAGGSGTRLWPLSTPEYPKHLLKINGDDRSLLQNTYQRAQKLSNAIYVVSEASHAHHVREQLPELEEACFVVEPGRRGTANCIVAALAHLTDRVDNDEPIAFMAADHFIRDTQGFAHSFKLASAASKAEGNIVLVGVEPEYPATGFGYIQKGELADEEKFIYRVNSFKEKPGHDTALEYLKGGNYLWNCGYFVASLNTFSAKMQKHAQILYDNYQKLLNAKSDQERSEIYLGFESDAIDYALIEKVDDLLVVPASFDWLDLGSYGDLHKAVGGDEKGNYIGSGHVELEDVENSYIQNYEDKPLAVIGLDNIAIINTPQGLLITRKDLAQQVGNVSKRINQGGKQ